LHVAAKAIYPLNFYSGSSVCSATASIISGLRKVGKMTQLPLRLFFHEHGSSSGALGFHECGSGSWGLSFMAPAPASCRFHTSIFWLSWCASSWMENEL